MVLGGVVSMYGTELRQFYVFPKNILSNSIKTGLLI